MNIHIIKSHEVEEDLVSRVVSILGSIPGPLRFIGQSRVHDPDTNVFESREYMHFEWDTRKKVPLEIGSGHFIPPRTSVHWLDMFSMCQEYRSLDHIEQQDLIILLTAKTNHRNWFASLDPNMPSNGFVHTADWELYTDAPPEFPIAYMVISLVLQQHIFSNYETYKHLVHKTPRGCINDFCGDKRDIILKLRTADICTQCTQVLQRHYSLQIIEHALGIIESIRTNMLSAQRLMQNATPSRMIIDRNYRIVLPDFNNTEIPLRPLEKALYVLFLRHPEGILISNLCDHRTELMEIYGNLCENGDRSDITERIADLTNALSNSSSEKISRIKRAFEQTIGPVLSRHYYIQGERGGDRFIPLDRAMVVFE